MSLSFVGWSSGGWKGINARAADHPGWADPGYDDSAWPTVTLPLGSPGGGCPIHSEHPPATAWPTNTEYLLRRTFLGSDFTVEFAIDNQADIYWDGVFVASGYNQPTPDDEQCPERDDNAPASGTLGAGSHVLAIHCIDRGVESYFDCSVRLTQQGWKVGKVAIG